MITNPMQDHAAAVRTATAAVLAAAGTIAQDRVEQERVDPIAPGDAPRLIVFADQSAQTDSTAGTEVRFTLTLSLTIQALVQRAALADALTDLDTLVAQVKYALFCDPAWVVLAANIATCRVTNSFKSGGDYVTGDARIQITLTWFEAYDPDLTTLLSGLNATTDIGQDGTIISQFLTGS